MTTRFAYKYYDVYSHEHKGKFPHTFWDSQPIPLHGCPAVTVCLRVFPNGDSGVKGAASAYIMFHSSDPSCTLHAKFRIGINNAISSDTIVTMGKGAIEFGRGWGFKHFCDMSIIFKQPQTILSFSITVLKFTQRMKNNLNNEITIIPVGVQEIVCECDKDKGEAMKTDSGAASA